VFSYLNLSFRPFQPFEKAARVMILLLALKKSRKRLTGKQPYRIDKAVSTV
jgi:hypothetical protein